MALKQTIKKIIEEVLEIDNVVLEKPKDISMGHFATPVAFSLAKKLRKSPMIIADDLSKKFEDIDRFEKVESVKGFINFKLSSQYLEELSNQAFKDGINFAKDNDINNKKILLEFVSANPTGPLHIGHARGAVFGDVLARLGKYLGYDLTTEYYINDAGAQMQLLGESIYLAAKEYIFLEDVEYPQSYYRGEYLIEIAKMIVEKFDDDIFADRTRLTELALFAKDEVMKIIIKDLEDMGIKFDNFISEKSLYDKWETTKDVLFRNDSLYEKDNKVWLKSTQYGDEVDRVVVRDNGIPTYLAGDIIYHKNKFDRGFETLINIWGADHHGYITRVKSAIKFLGNNPDDLEVILSQMVSLLKGKQPYKMSKRAGNVILMSDIFQEIGKDALRYIFLTKKSDTHLEFDIDDLKKQDSSNPVFYIQYAYARIHQLHKKSSFSYEEILETKLDNISTDEKDILYTALLLSDILSEAFHKREVHKITDYLYSLANLVHKFYNEYRIVGNENEKRYLKVLQMSALSIEVAFDILGITAKKEM